MHTQYSGVKRVQLLPASKHCFVNQINFGIHVILPTQFYSLTTARLEASVSLRKTQVASVVKVFSSLQKISQVKSKKARCQRSDFISPVNKVEMTTAIKTPIKRVVIKSACFVFTLCCVYPQDLQDLINFPYTNRNLQWLNSVQLILARDLGINVEGFLKSRCLILWKIPPPPQKIVRLGA